jgi:hypothetical protein
MARYLYSELSRLVEARANCAQQFKRSGKDDPWVYQGFEHERRIVELCRKHMPSGSGFDSGTTLDLEASHAEKLVFATSFHHMNEHGYYDGWTDHKVVVTPSFQGFNMRIGGQNRYDIKEVIYEVFRQALRETEF